MWEMHKELNWLLSNTNKNVCKKKKHFENISTQEL